MTLATLTPSDKSTLASKQAAQAAAARESLQRIDTFAAQLKTIVQAAAQTAESIDHTERTVRDTVRKMGKQAIELFIQLQGHGDLGETVLNRLPDPLPESEAKLLITSADCKGVPLVKEDSAKVAAFETAEKNPGNRRMATVASVYTVDPHVRTAEHITAALVRDDRDDSKEKIKRPRPQNKNTTAHFPGVQEPAMAVMSRSAGFMWRWFGSWDRSPLVGDLGRY